MNWNQKMVHTFQNKSSDCFKLIPNWCDETIADADRYLQTDYIGLAEQKVRQNDSEMRDISNFTIFNSTRSGKIIHGTGFMIRKCLRQNIIDFRDVNERICILRLI